MRVPGETLPGDADVGEPVAAGAGCLAGDVQLMRL
jgi:hypothetical protein